MPETPIPITVAGQSHRISTDAPPHHIQHLAHLLDARTSACNSRSRLTPTRALLYAGLTLVEDLEVAQQRHRDLQTQYRASLEAILTRIDAALEALDALPLAPQIPLDSSTLP